MTDNLRKKVAIIGAGASGLMVADTLSHYPIDVFVYEQMPTAGRKILWAGKTGLNVSHNEPIENFLMRYTPSGCLTPYITKFGAVEIREFMANLGIQTYIGSSGRIFPVEMKASKFLRAWLNVLNDKGIQFFYHHELLSIQKNQLTLLNKKTNKHLCQEFDTIVLACGGGSYKKLGSTGTWQAWFDELELSPLYASNVGIIKVWSSYVAENFGKPIKNITAWVNHTKITGDIVITHYGLESGVIYALNKELRDAWQNHRATLFIDLLPDVSQEDLYHKLVKFKQSKQTLTNSLRKLGLDALKIDLIRECTPKADWQDLGKMARHIKSLPVDFADFRPMDEAISTGGGVRWQALDEFQLKSNPYVFCAGEMLDFDAPTGGYLLTACFATGRAVGERVATYLGGL